MMLCHVDLLGRYCPHPMGGPHKAILYSWLNHRLMAALAKPRHEELANDMWHGTGTYLYTVYCSIVSSWTQAISAAGCLHEASSLHRCW